MKNVFFLLLALLIGYLIYKKFFALNDTKARLIRWVDSNGATAAEQQRYKEALDTMSDNELKAVDTFVSDYLIKGKQVPDSPLKTSIQIISKKYGIFT